ncbi:MAG: MGMT family protein [Elusimicrobia bacterium]|nr:MGMT family protein [Elusimicrobiota bacterium]
MALSRKILKKLSRYPEFDRKVWRACAQIPRGQTRSYGWIAKRIGNPKAARAVGQALKRNPFAPIIPCHRVLRQDGSLGGYGGKRGIPKKIRLLQKEGINTLRSAPGTSRGARGSQRARIQAAQRGSPYS